MSQRAQTATVFLLCAAWFGYYFCMPASAADWTIVPQVKTGAQYDSNLNFSFLQPKSDVILNLSPAVDFTYSSEVSQLTGRVALDGLLYLKDSNLNTINQNYTILGQQKVAPRLAFTFGGGYIVDNTLAEELITSGFVMTQTRRESLQAAPGLAFNLTERALLKMGYAYNQVEYQSPRYNDYSQHTVNLGLNYLLKNEKTTLSSIVLGRWTGYPAIDNFYRNIGTYGGLEHRFAEDWTLSGFAGLNYNWFTSQAFVFTLGNSSFAIPTRQKQETFTISPFFNIEGKRRWTKNDLVFGYKVDQSPSAGGAVYQYHNAYGGVGANFSERLRGSLRGNLYYSNSTVSSISNYQNLTLSLSPEISYRITEKLSVNSSYRFSWREEFNPGRTADRHQVWLYVNYSNPLHFQK